MASGWFGVINIGEGLFKDITDKRRKFSAGMCLSIGKNGHEVERRATPKAGTPPKKFGTLPVIQDVDQVIL